MGTNDLRKRANWQTAGGKKAGAAEHSFYEVFTEAFRGTDLSVRRKVTEFSTIYVGVELPKAVLAEIYCPSCGIEKHGFRPDYAIDNEKLRFPDFRDY